MDFKGAVQERADDIALDKYSCSFYELSENIQHEIAIQAHEDVLDTLRAGADSLRKTRKGE